MYKVYVGKNSGYDTKKYNTNDIINACLSATQKSISVKDKIVKFNIALGFYMKEFEDTTVAKFEDYNQAIYYGTLLKRKLNQKEVLITSDYEKNYEKRGFIKKKCYTVEFDNDFRDFQSLINNVNGGTLYIYDNKIVLEMFDFYGDLSSEVMKLKNKGIKVRNNVIFVKSLKNNKEVR